MEFVKFFKTFSTKGEIQVVKSGGVDYKSRYPWNTAQRAFDARQGNEWTAMHLVPKATWCWRQYRRQHPWLHPSGVCRCAAHLPFGVLALGVCDHATSETQTNCRSNWDTNNNSNLAEMQRPIICKFLNYKVLLAFFFSV